MLSADYRVQDVLGQVRRFHAELADLYGDLSETTNNEEVRLCLHYMRAHERNLERSVADYLKGTSPERRAAKMPYHPEEDLLIPPSADQFERELTVKGVVGLWLELADRLILFYQEAALCQEISELKELFGDLRARIESEKDKMASGNFSFSRM